MKRRQVIVLGLSGGAGLVAAGLGLHHVVLSGAPDSGLGEGIDALLHLADGAGATGESLAALGNDKAALARELQTLVPAGPDADAAGLLSRQIAADFASGRIVEHEGWMLSRTEAVLARLRFLVAGKRERTAPEPRQEAELVQVLDWGPRQTVLGLPFNVQRDGHYGLWFKVASAPPWLRVRVNGEEMPTFVQSGTVTSGIHGTLRKIIEQPGQYPIEFVDPPTGRVQSVGSFEVLPRPKPFVHADGTPSAVFCELQGWGPTETVAGVPANPQPDGSMGIWIRTSCVPPDSYVLLGDIRLRTSVQSSLVTATAPLALLEAPGQLPLSIVHVGSGERMTVGAIQVLP